MLILSIFVTFNVTCLTVASLTRNTFCLTRSLSNAAFSFLITWCSPVQNLLLCTKFHRNRMIFTEIWRYIDFQNGGRPPSSNCFTIIRDHPQSLLLAAAACQIHVNLITPGSVLMEDVIWQWHISEDIAIWIFAYLAWNAYSGPQNGVLGDFGPLNVISSLLRPPKSTSLCKSAGIWPVGELTESVMYTHTWVNLYSVHA